MVYKFEAEKESAGRFGVKESLRIQSVLGTAKAEWLSPRADGIENGSEQKMFYRVPEEMVQEYPALKQAKQILSAYLDEIVCDAYAGINRMGLGADKLQNAVRTEADRTASQSAKKPAQTRGPPERYAIGKTTGNKPFVEVEQDILAGVPEADWVKTVKENLKKKFPNGITVGNSEIHIDKQSRREMTFSRYMQQLYNSDPKLRADKLRATDNADEILQAATDWVNEGLKHPRKDNIKDFARGEVLLRVGGNDYTAEVVVGTRESGSMLLYDILNLQPTSFTEKETDAAITVNPSPGAGRNTASVSANNIRRSGQKSQGKFSPAATPKENDKTALAYFGKTYKWSETDYYAKMARAFLMDRDGGGAEKKIAAYYRCVAKG